MTAQAVTRPLHTDNITVMSNVTCVTASGNKITRLGAVSGYPTIHIDFDVQHAETVPAVLGHTEELGLALKPKDAVELGLLLVAMGLQGSDPAEVSAVSDRLSNLISELN